jgi:hypothetical protein
MSRAAIVITIGVLVVLLPILGIPSFWKTVLFSISGLGLIFIGALMKRERNEESVQQES